MVNTEGFTSNSDLQNGWVQNQIFDQIMPIERPVGHSGILSEMPSRSTVSSSGQPWKLRGRSCSWRLSQGCSGIKQNMPVSSRASQHLAPAAWKQINTIESTQLCFFVCGSRQFTDLFCKVALSVSLFINFATSSFGISSAEPPRALFSSAISVVSISFPVWNFICLKFLFSFFLEGKKTTTVN